MENFRRGITEPQESDFASTSTEERKGDTLLGCSGRDSLKEGAVWRNRPMRDLVKFRNLKEREGVTVVSDVFSYPRFASHRTLLGYAVNTGLGNSKGGPRDLRDVTRNSTQRYVLRMSDSSVYKRDRTKCSTVRVVKIEKSASAVRFRRMK
jgi:hypothetical protein